MNRIQRFFWRLWVVVSASWVLALILIGSWEEMRTDRGDLLIEWPVYWAFILGPPLLLVVAGLLLAWVFNALSDRPNN